MFLRPVSQLRKNDDGAPFGIFWFVVVIGVPVIHRNGRPGQHSVNLLISRVWLPLSSGPVRGRAGSHFLQVDGGHARSADGVWLRVHVHTFEYSGRWWCGKLFAPAARGR